MRGGGGQSINQTISQSFVSQSLNQSISTSISQSINPSPSDNSDASARHFSLNNGTSPSTYTCNLFANVTAHWTCRKGGGRVIRGRRRRRRRRNDQCSEYVLQEGVYNSMYYIRGGSTSRFRCLNPSSSVEVSPSGSIICLTWVATDSSPNTEVQVALI